MNDHPDGSLCRITSSAKSIVSDIKIVKVSENETLNTDEPEYKLVFIGEEENDSEPLSEESGDDFEKVFQQNLKLNAENNDKDKDVKVQKDIEESKHEMEKFHKREFNGRFRPKNSHRSYKNYKSFSKRNFNSSGNVAKPYNRSKANTSNKDIDPWLHPPASVIAHSYGLLPHYPPRAEHILNSSVAPRQSVGLLGDSPSPHFLQHNVPSTYQSNPYMHGQNFGTGDYSSSYQNAPNRQCSSPPSNYQNWKNVKKSNRWKRNQQENRQNRRNDNSYFSYRN